MNGNEIVKKIQDHKFVILTGDSDGRYMLRDLLSRNDKRKCHTLCTRRYKIHYLLNTNESLYYDDTSDYEYTIHLLKHLGRKKNLVKVDNFSDIYGTMKFLLYNNEENNKGLFTAIKNETQIIIKHLKKCNKSVILFVDSVVGTSEKGHQITMDIHELFLREADLIIRIVEGNIKIVKEIK